MKLIQEITLDNPPLCVDWSRDPESNEIYVGVATTAGKFLYFKYGEWDPKNWFEIDPAKPVVEVVGNHDPFPSSFAFALGTLEEGIFGVNLNKGITIQKEFLNTWGTLAFVKSNGKKSQTLVSGGLNKELQGLDASTGKRKWRHKFQSGIAFVETLDLDEEPIIIAGDLQGNVQRCDAELGTLQWKTKFDYCARFCLPTIEEGTRDKIWMAGTDAKKIHLFRVRDFKPMSPIMDLECKNYPWVARRTSLASILVTTYNFADIANVSPERHDARSSIVFCMTNLGNPIWESTISGSAENVFMAGNDGDRVTDIFISTNNGHILQVNPDSGEILRDSVFGTSQIKCTTLLPNTPKWGDILITAHDDGALRFIQTS